jgi:hypothetical protein
VNSEPERHQNGVAGRIPRRATDIVEDAAAWVLASMALLVALVAVMAGTSTYWDLADRARVETAERTAAQAVLLEPSAPIALADGGYLGPVDVPAQWTGLDGEPRTRTVPLWQPEPSGAEVTLWMDHSGAVVDPPTTVEQAMVDGFLMGFWRLVGGVAVLALGWVLVRRVTGLANARRWARDWAAVEPLWRSR